MGPVWLLWGSNTNREALTRKADLAHFCVVTGRLFCTTIFSALASEAAVWNLWHQLCVHFTKHTHPPAHAGTSSWPESACSACPAVPEVACKMCHLKFVLLLKQCLKPRQQLTKGAGIHEEQFWTKLCSLPLPFCSYFHGSRVTCVCVEATLYVVHVSTVV